jgi:hypothetical protein
VVANTERLHVPTSLKPCRHLVSGLKWVPDRFAGTYGKSTVPGRAPTASIPAGQYGLKPIGMGIYINTRLNVYEGDQNAARKEPEPASEAEVVGSTQAAGRRLGSTRRSQSNIAAHSRRHYPGAEGSRGRTALSDDRIALQALIHDLRNRPKGSIEVIRAAELDRGRLQKYSANAAASS